MFFEIHDAQQKKYLLCFLLSCILKSPRMERNLRVLFEYMIVRSQKGVFYGRDDILCEAGTAGGIGGSVADGNCAEKDGQNQR